MNVRFLLALLIFAITPSYARDLNIRVMGISFIDIPEDTQVLNVAEKAFGFNADIVMQSVRVRMALSDRNPPLADGFFLDLLHQDAAMAALQKAGLKVTRKSLIKFDGKDAWEICGIDTRRR